MTRNVLITTMIVLLFSDVTLAGSRDNEWTSYDPEVAAQLGRQADEMELANDIRIGQITKQEKTARKEARSAEIKANDELSKSFYCKTYGRGC